MHPLERYLAGLRSVRHAGGVPETSGYPCLQALLDEVGDGFKPKVICVLHPASTGAGIADAGLFEKSQIHSKKGEVKKGQLPLRGVVEVKPVADVVAQTIGSEQVTRYVAHYGQVLVTNYREFALLVRSAEGQRKVDSFTLAPTVEDFWALAEHPRAAAEQLGGRFLEFLKRALHTSTTLADPKDVAWFLASYAREALEHLSARELPGLDTVRSAFEEALGVSFTGEKGDHFFRSSLVQTLFYGVFSAWVLWCREQGGRPRTPFDWRDSAWTLRVPMIRALFEQVATPSALGQLGLKPYLDRTGDVLNRVDHERFFGTFRLGEAVQYFYEPFLEAFDPELRKELGVWYTPKEIVQYQVARVDATLKTFMHLPRGLADPSVYVLDPCCGTGAYLVEVIRSIQRTMQADGDALLAGDLRRAVRERIFGFELLPASFVIAHLQLGLLLHELGAPLGEAGDRAGVFLTNALTGWGADHDRPHLPFPELEQERDKAEEVKRATPILVILGNPPYNGFAGVTESEEERELTNAYRTTRQAPAPQGQGLNDLYVRFFRMAERKIVEGTGKGIVCFITNYSWLDGLSFTGMRERFIEAFDLIEIDSLNGDRYRTGKLTPEGLPDPSVFSTASNPEGIQVGTAITLALRWAPEMGNIPSGVVSFRDRWGETKLAALAEDARDPFTARDAMQDLIPEARNGFVFRPIAEAPEYVNWPTLPQLMPTSFPGVKTSRDDVVVDIDRARLVERMRMYFDPGISDEELARRVPGAMESTARFNAAEARRTLLEKGFRGEQIRRYLYRPLDLRWIYWEPETKLLDEKRTEYLPHLMEGNRWLEARQRQPHADFDRGCVTTVLADNLGNGLSNYFPIRLRAEPERENLFSPGYTGTRSNVSPSAAAWLQTMGEAREAGLYFHIVALLHAPAYRRENGDALRLDWPRIPLPRGMRELDRSVELGMQLTELLMPELTGNTAPSPYLRMTLREQRHLGGLVAADGRALDAERGDLAVTAGWGFRGNGGVTMPGRGRITERPDGALDIWLNDRAHWANVPPAVWDYTLGGYQVIKKWLSYREKALLGRDLTVEEARYVSEMIRRIAAILELGPTLDENYARVKANAFDWSSVAGTTPRTPA